MASATLAAVSEYEYLHSDYEPDRDYVDGELQERNVGERPHSLLQTILVAIFHANRKAWGIVAGTEMRVQVSRGNYRVPDVCVLRKSDPADDIVQKSPLVCIEVLSPEDRMKRIQERFADYARMGVENMWLFDPLSRRAWVVLPDGSQHRMMEEFIIPGTPIRIDLAEVFAELADMQTQN